MTLLPDVPVIVDGGDRACAGLLLELRARIAGLPGGRYALRTISAPPLPTRLLPGGTAPELTAHA